MNYYRIFQTFVFCHIVIYSGFMYKRLIPLLTLLLFVMGAIDAQNAIKSPDEFLPHRLGDQFTPHHMLTSYFEYLAANSTTTMKLERYGLTNEARPLQVAFFSSPENMAKLEEFRKNNMHLAGLGDDKTGGVVEGMPVIVWLNMSVHGNEPSGAECSMLLAWQLATQSEPDIQEWLKTTIVMIDPSSNPDGSDRYSSWYRSVSNLLKNTQHNTREHNEPWPGGRPNHYYYDLNRDWAWATQAETRQRLDFYQRWLPHVVADIHEQFIDDPYYFAPAAEPMHTYLTPWQRSFQTEIGANNARHFDANGWLYFTKEVFDLLYPSYGDTYPMFNGAIGMTYEQGGNGMAGRAITISNGDTLTLHDRIMHHLTTSRATIEIASKSAPKLVENFRNYYAKALASPPGQYGAFIIRDNNDPNKVNTFCQLLDRHKIKYGRAGTTIDGVKGYDYITGKETSTKVMPNDLVISAYQPKGVLVQVLMEPVPYLSDSLTYDITAWSLPLAHGFDAFAAKQRIDPKKEFTPYKTPEAMITVVPYAWCVRRKSMAEMTWLAELLEKGVKVRYASESFDMADQQFSPGTFIINRADNHTLESQLDGWVKTAADKANVTLVPLLSGTNSKGADLGSAKFKLVNHPSVAMLYGDDVDENAFGHTWYFFEQELGYPLSMIRPDQLKGSSLRGVNTLIIPNGSYHFDEKTLSFLRDWIGDGGRIIAVEGGVKAFADKSGFDIALKPEVDKDTITAKPSAYMTSERNLISDQLPGAIVKTKCDNTHPLGYGLSETYFSLKTSPAAFQLNNKLTNVIWLDEQYENYGFIGYRVKSRLSNSPVVALQQLGNGSVVYMADNPLFRSFWQAGKVLFANALFF